jgi:DivIVA domain-containing protein
VDRARFNPVRLHECYDMAEVDQFLDAVVEAAERNEPIAPLIDGARFTHVRLREGYDIDEVDAFLQQLKGAPAASDHPDLVQQHPGLLERLRRRL